MTEPGTLPTVAADGSMALDFAALRSQGIALIQRLAGGTWTDHNTHDPGITILEQLCYALTDLGYRARYELPDLLTRAGEDPYASLYTPAQILPTGPVTLTDLRKLVIDVPGVKNAWIDAVDEPLAAYDAVTKEVSYRAASDTGQPAAASPNVSEIRVKGLYRVRIEKSDLADINGTVIRREAVRRLHRSRGLAQDFEEIEVLQQQPIWLGAALEIDAVQDAAALLANVYQGIAAYMSPSVPFRSLAEMLERGRRVDEIFEGPLLEHGFIDSEELARIERRSTLRISDLIHALMAVPGVMAVKDIHFLNSDGTPRKDWVLDVPADRTPRFDLQYSKIRLEKRGLRAAEGIQAAAQRLSTRLASAEASPVIAASQERDLRPGPGRDRNVASYYPVRQQFPATYGIGADGLSRSAPAARKAQAKQLKAYLMFYDQLLANHFAQLANVGKLFSFHDATADSYFSQAVPDGDAPELDVLRSADPQAHRDLLRQITEDPESDPAASEQGLRRRNRFLDHLLARFGQHFRELALLQPAADRGTPQARLAHHKRAFLRDYPRIGRDRGVAFDCLEPAGEDNLSGLERALRHKLGVSAPEERFHIVEHVLLRPIAGDANQRAPLFRAAQVRDPYSLQLSFVFPNWGRYEADNFKQFVQQTVREETPAHLTAYIAWKSKEAMQEFEAAHKAWLERLRDDRLARLRR
jgi:hypothetical protein